MKINTKIYQDEINSIDREINTIKQIDALNQRLHKYNWIFMHPYNQGFETNVFQNLLDNSNNDDETEERIFEFFARKFLDLNNTVTFIDGFYKKRPYISEYANRIEESVILCLQKDFSGAITLLIPILEGSLRKYLIVKKGEKAKTIIDISELLKAFNYLLADYIKLEKEYLELQYGHLRASNNYFDTNQEKQILKRKKQYFELWVKQLKDYITNNLFLNTKVNTISDSINRHLIFHGMSENIDYSFRNYLRLINCINFLSWTFGVTNRDCSVLAEVDEKEAIAKANEYYKILITSEALSETKSKILGTENYSFKKYIDKNLYPLISIREIMINQILKGTKIIRPFQFFMPRGSNKKKSMFFNLFQFFKRGNK